MKIIDVLLQNHERYTMNVAIAEEAERTFKIAIDSADDLDIEKIIAVKNTALKAGFQAGFIAAMSIFLDL